MFLKRLRRRRAAPLQARAARPLGRAAAVDRVEDQPDHLRADEEELRAVGQADEQVEAAEDADHARPATAAGARNLRSRSGSRRRSTSIAAQTATNAASVPALASAAIAVSGISPAKTEVTIAVKIVIRTGVPRRRNPRQAARQQPVAGDGEEDPALAVEEGEDDGRQGDHRRRAEDPRRPRLADLAQDQRQRLRRCWRSRCRRPRRSPPRRRPCR